MSYKLVWTVIATLGVLTQVPGMIESHTFNRCFNKRMSQERSFQSDPNWDFELDVPDLVRFCNGGT